MNKGMNVNVTTGESDNYETPPWLFRALDSEFGFTIDAVASAQNTKCGLFISDIDAATYTVLNGEAVVFCNPPYSNIMPFVKKALYGDAQVWVLLLPVRTDNDWFRLLSMLKRCEWRWFRKRIKFYMEGEEMGSPRFPSVMVVVR